MRNISFALTTAQVRARTKTVTRRLGWLTLTPGTLLQPVVKGMGLGKGGKVEKIGGPIRVLTASRERLDRLMEPGYGQREIVLEGCPQMSLNDFMAFFTRTHKRLKPSDLVTRIEFEYVEEP